MYNFTTIYSIITKSIVAKLARIICSAFKSREKYKLVIASIVLLLSIVNKSFAATRTGNIAGGGNVNSSVCNGTNNLTVLSFSLGEVTTANTFSAIKVITSGTGAVTTDVVGYSFWYNTTNTLTGATYLGYTANTGAGTITSPPLYAAGHSLAAGTTYYFFVQANFSPAAISGHVLTCATPTTAANFTWANTETAGTNTATAGTSTITSCSCTSSYVYTSAVQTYTVPLGCTSVNVNVAGAQGGSYASESVGGAGAAVSATISSLTGGQVLQLYVGGKGGDGSAGAGGNAAGGGAGGGTGGNGGGGAGGGAASDIRTVAGATTTALNSRLVTGGAGGGGGFDGSGENGGIGGYGSGAGGGKGLGVGGGAWTAANNGSPGTLSAGGAAATTATGGGVTAGALGAGGNATTTYYGGGGGGGLYGGGGSFVAGGPGGSSYAATVGTVTVTGITYTDGSQGGNGFISITPNTAVYAVTGGGGYCTGGTGVAIGLSGSQVGVNYQLYNGASAVGGAVTGTGSAFNFGTTFTTATTYTVLATATCSGATTVMSGSAVVSIVPPPNVTSWSSPTASSACTGFGNTITVNSSSLAAGTYTVTYSVSGGTTYSGTATLTMGSGTGTFNTTVLTGGSSTTVTITAVTNSTGCSSSVSSSNTVTFSVGASPTLNPGVSVTESNIGSNPITYGAGASAPYYTDITSITAQLGSGAVNTLTAGTDYSVTATGITLIPTLSDGYLTTPGSYTIIVNATGYCSAIVTQVIGVGAGSQLVLTQAPVGSPTAPNLTTQPQVTIEDIFGNVVTSSSATVVASALSTTGSWTISGTSSVAASSGVANTFAITASSPTPINATIQFASAGLPSITTTFLIAPNGAYTWHTLSSSTYADLSQLSNWTSSSSGGSGIAPLSFTSANQTYVIDYGTSPSLANNWTVSGSGSTVTIGNGTTPITFTIPSTNTMTGTLNIAALGALDCKNATYPTLGTLNATSTLIIDGTASPTFPSATGGNYGSVTFQTTGITSIGSGTYNILGNFRGVGSGTTGTNGVINCNGGSTTTFNISGNFTLANSATFNAASTSGTLTYINVGGNDTVTGAAVISPIATLYEFGPTITFNGASTIANPQYIFSNSSYLSEYGGAMVVNSGSVVMINGGQTNVPEDACVTGTAENIAGMTVNSGGTLMFGASSFLYDQTATDKFTVASGGTVITACAGGIANAVASPVSSINGFATISMSTGGNYIFNGTSAQVTGASMPTGMVSPGSITCNNSTGLTLTTASSFATGASLKLENGTMATTPAITFATGSNLYVDGGHLASAPATLTSADVNLYYYNLGNGSSSITTTNNEWPATFLGNVIVNYSGATVNVNASKALTGPNASGYGNMTLTAGTLSAGSSSISLYGNWSNAGSSTFNAGSGTVTFNGTTTTAQTIGGASATTFNNLTIAPTGTGGVTLGLATTIGSGSTLTLSTGTFTNSTYLTMGSGSNLVRDAGIFSAAPTFGTGVNLTYSGTGGSVTTTNNEWPTTLNGTVTINKNATITLNSSKTLTGTGSLTLTGSTSILSGGSYGITLSGNWINNASTTAFSVGTSTVTFNGSGAQTIGGSAANQFNCLTLAAAAGLGSNATVTGTLALGSNILTTGSYNITCPGNVPVSLSSGYVYGNLYKTLVGGGPYTFEVGDVDYAPASLAVTGSPTGSIGVTVAHGNHPALGGSGIDGSNDVAHYWTITGTSGTAPTTVAPTFTYQTADVDGGSGSNATYDAQLYTSGTWGTLISSGIINTMTPTPATTLPAAASYVGAFVIGNHNSMSGLAMTPDYTPPNEDNLSTHPITFTDDGVWAENFTLVTAQRTGSTLISTLTSGTDYNVSGPAGTLSLVPTNNGKLDTAGYYTITVYATGYSGSTVIQQVLNGAANHLIMQTQPVGPATNGSTLATQPAINIVDRFGNATPSSAIITASVTASSGSWTLGGSSLSATAVSGTATFSGLTATSLGPVTTASLTFTSPAITGTVSSTFTIVAPSAPVLTAASGVTVDNPFSITYVDNPTWDGDITSSSITVTSSLGGPYTIPSSAYTVGSGQITFSVSATPYLQTAGTYTISVTATGFGSTSCVQAIGVGAAAQLAMSVQPTAPSYNGGTLATQPVVFVTDQYGNAVTGSTAVVTATVGAGSWTIGGPSLTATAVSGVATFSNLTATSSSAVTGATITFTSPGFASVTSASFNIPSPPNNYYNISSATNLASTSSWTTDPIGAAAGGIGSGMNPSNFTTASQAFNIVNGSTLTITGAWTVSGLGSYIVVGNGTTSLNFSDGGNAITATINVNANATLTIASATIPTFGTLSTLSTVVFNGSVAQAIPNTVAYGNLAYSGSNTGSLQTGATTVYGNYAQSSGTVSYPGTGAMSFNVTGNFTMTGGTFNGCTTTTGFPTVTVDGNMSLTGSTFTSDHSQEIFLYGNLILEGATTLETTAAGYYEEIFFENTATSYASPNHLKNGSTGAVIRTEIITEPNSWVQLDSNFVSSATTVYLAPYGNIIFPAGVAYSGTGYFELLGTATMYTANTGGLNGSVSSTAARQTWTSGTNYVFNGTAAQVTGSELLATIPSAAYVTIDNSAGVTLSQTTTFASGSAFNLQAGTLTNTAASLKMSAGSNLYVDNGHLSVVPTTYSPNLIYTNLGQNLTSSTTSSTEWPATFAYPVTINYAGNTIGLDGSKSMTTTTSGLTLTAGTLDVTAANNYSMTTTGSWTNNAGTSAFNAEAGTVTFNGTAAQTIGGSYGTVFNTLTINNTGGITLSAATSFASGRTLNLQQGVFTNGSNLSMSSGSNVNVDKGSLSAAPATYSGVNLTYANLGIGGNVTTSYEWPSTFSGNVTINKTGNTITQGGNQAVNGNITLSAGTLATGSNALSLTGTWTNNAGISALTPGTTSVTFNGSSPQTLTGTYTTPFFGLTLNNTAGLTLGLSTTLTGTLTLSNGILTTGSNTLTLSTAPGTVSRTSSTSSNYVNGTLAKAITGYGASAAINYEVGDADYAPVSIALQADATAGQIAVQSISGRTSAYATAAIDGTFYVDHYWNISSPVAATWSGTMTPTFTYNSADIGGGSNTGWVAQIYSLSGTPGWEPVISAATDPTGNTTTVPSGTSSSAGTYGYYIVGLNDANAPPVFTPATGVTEDNAPVTPATYTGTMSATWKSHITLVTATGPGGVTYALTGGGADYATAASGSSGTFSLIPTASDNYLTTAGTYTINISSIGYTTATFVQAIGAGAPAAISMSVQPTAPATNGGVLGTVPVVNMTDQYGNPAAGSATITGNAIAGTVGATTVIATWTAGANVEAGSSPITFTGFTASSYGPVTGASIQFTGTVGSATLTPVTSNSFNIPAPGAPTLIAAAGATVDNPFSITYVDNPTWDAAITSVKVNGSTLSPSAWSVGSGSLTLTPSLSTLLETPGSYTITVVSTGFPNDVLYPQAIAAGVGATLVMSVQPAAPAYNGGPLATQPVVLIKDYYGNPTTSGSAVTAGSSGGSTPWTLGGTVSVNGVSGTVTYTNLSATSIVPEAGATITFSITSTYGTATVTSNSFNIPNPPITYYDITGTGVDLSQTSNWTTNSGGSGGTSPLNFTSNSQKFVIQNGTNPTLANPLTISGSGSYLSVGNASAAVNFIIPSGAPVYTGTVNVTANATLTTANTTMPVWGTLDGASTVVYNGTSQVIPVAPAYGNLAFSGTTGSVGTGTLTVGGNYSVTASTLTSPTASVTKITGSLNISGGTLTNAGSGTINLSGDLKVTGTGALTGTTLNTVNFINTSTTQNITWSSIGANTNAKFNVNTSCTASLSTDLPLSSGASAAVSGTLNCGTNAISGSGAFSLSSGATLNTASTTGLVGSITTSGTQTFTSGASYIFSASGAISTPWNVASNWATTSAPANVSISNAITLTNNAAFSPTGTLTVPSGATLDMGTYALGGSPTVANNGTIQTENVSSTPLPSGYTWGGTIAYAGAAAQTIVAGTYNNLQLNNASGISLTSSITVNGTLTLTSGLLTLGSYNLTLSSANAVAGTPGSANMIVATGPGKINAAFTANGSFTYPVGDASGSYTPVTLNVSGSSYSSGNVSVNLSASKPTQNANTTNYINRYWSILPTGISGLSYTATATYVPGDIVGTEANIAMGQYSSALPWIRFGLESGHVLTSGAVTSAGTSIFSGINNSVPVAVSSANGIICGSGSYTLSGSASTGDPALSYAWSPATALSAVTGVSVSASPTITTTYTLTVTDGNGFTGTTATTTVTVASDPAITATVTPNPVCNGSTLYLNSTPSGGSGTYSAYTWSGPDAFIATVQNASVSGVTSAAAGAYTISVTDDNGCVGSAVTASVTVMANQWAGTTSTSWSTAANWACGIVPTATDSVIIPIPASYVNPPTLDVNPGYAQYLSIKSNAVLTLSGSNNLDVSGNIANNGTITGSGIVYLDGSSAQVLSGNGNISNLTVANSSTTSINSSTDTLGIAGTLLLNAGTFNTNGSLMLVSDSSGSGSIGTISGGANLSGSVVIQQYVPGGRRAFRFIAHPFTAPIALSQIEPYVDITGTGGAASGFTTTISNAPSAFWYNPLVGNSSLGSDPGWTDYTNTDGAGANAFNQYEGIRLYFRGAKGTGLTGATYTIVPTTYRTYGTVNTGTQSIVLTKGTGANEDYNLIGNPYPSPVDIGTATHNAGALLTGGYFYVWNPYTGTAGQFEAISTASPYYIAANVSFEVRTTTDGNALTISESDKGSAPTEILMRDASEDNLDLDIYDNTYHLWDKLIFKFNDKATDNEDARYDGAKPPSPATLNFYSWSADNVKLAADVRPFTSGKVIPLGLTSNYAQQFIIKADNISIPNSGQVYLHDKYLQTYTLLQQGTEYKFSITKDSASQGDKRFELALNPSDAVQATGLDVQMVPNPASSDVTISYTAKSKSQTTVKVMNVEGVTVLTEDLGVQQSGSVQIALNKLASGVYLVEFTSGTDKVVHRLVKE